jgi:hypothetical protein
MEYLIALGGLVAVMALSIPIALGLVWLCLAAAFRFLPSRAGAPPKRVSAASRIAVPRVRTAWTPVQNAATAKGLPQAFQAGLHR